MKTNWHLIQQVTFLFLFIYSILYITSNVSTSVLWADPIWSEIIPWFADLLGHNMPIKYVMTGSGDTTYHYYQVLLFGLLAFLLAIPMSLWYRKWNYNILSLSLVVFIRYFLAFQMLFYGLAKVYDGQFLFPNEVRLDQRIGDISPMGLLWTFMGYSKTYTVFTGLLECIGGTLLFSRRTTILGALIVFGVMSNVMMLNYCYDVPLKLFSTHLVLMSLFLILLDVKRLFYFFIENRSVAARPTSTIIPTQYLRTKMIVKWVVIFAQLSFINYKMIEYSNLMDNQDQSPLFHGKYIVESFERRTVNPKSISSNPNALNWETFYSWKGDIYVETKSGSQLKYQFQVDTTTKVLNLKLNSDPDFFSLRYDISPDEKIHIYGVYRTDTLDIVVGKKDHLLVNRGFHWVNEVPFNR
ncbi:MAG: hypothetical protein AAGI23_16900 [Bacteroidota bacterium]